MFFQRLKTPGLGHNSYVLACGDGLAVVVDPRRDVDEYLRLARENDLSIAYVLETRRSGVAASILKRNGFTRIHNMLGGISAREKLRLPLEKPGEAKKAD